MRITQWLETGGVPVEVDAGTLLCNLVGTQARTECYHNNPVAQAREVVSTDTSELQSGG